MKITRLKNGYRINCSDSDYEMLVHLVNEGESHFLYDDESDNPLRDAGWSPAAQSAATRRSKGGGLLRVDENRR